MNPIKNIFSGCSLFSYCYSVPLSDKKKFDLYTVDEAFGDDDFEDNQSPSEFCKQITPENIEKLLCIKNDQKDITDRTLNISGGKHYDLQDDSNPEGKYYFCTLTLSDYKDTTLVKTLNVNLKDNKFFIKLKNDEKVVFDDFNGFLKHFLNPENHENVNIKLQDCFIIKNNDVAIQYIADVDEK